MPLEKPPLPHAEAGRPITAQGWNAIVDALSRLYDAVAAIGSGVLEVSVTSNGAAVAGALVVAAPVGDGPPMVAVPPFGGRPNHVVAGVSDGQWRVFVAAPGFADAAVDTAVPAAAAVVVEMTPVGPVVPDLFGQPLQTAVSALTAAGAGIGLVLDALGREVPRTPIPAEYQNGPVLGQLPVAGTRLEPTDRVELLVAAPVAQAPVVTMPNLAGLSQEEAARVLEQLGLRVGRIQVVSS